MIVLAAIAVVGVGLEAKQLTLEAAELLASGARVILHTGHIGCADWLAERGISFETLDALYEECEDFDEHARRTAEVVALAAKDGDVVYAVYDVRDRSVLELSKLERELRVIAGPPVEGPLFAFLDGAALLLEASDWENFSLSPLDCALVREIDSRELAAEVKLKLMERYPEEAMCFILSEGKLSRLPLYELDRMKRYDHRTCALIPPERDITKLERYGFDDLMRIMAVLMGPNGCPWDRAQTHESLRPFLLEESYEVIDAINAGDTDHLYDELGDILMQVAIHAEYARRHGEFDISDSTTAICRKMIDRHSHIFGADRADDPDSVLDLWTKNKMKERGQRTHAEVLREVSRSLPALLRARKLAEKSARAGVHQSDVCALAREAAQELARLPEAKDGESALGIALFNLCALARELDLDLEIALNEAADRFVERFAAFEERCLAEGHALPLHDENAANLWNQVKLQENANIRQELTGA